jgi:superfamily I DNA/RNA helicase
METECVIGPPGTGKTYYIEQDIAKKRPTYKYITYNRSMAQQSRERLNSEKTTTGTLHSIISQTLGLHEFISAKEINIFAKKMGLDTEYFNYEEQQHETKMDRFLRYYAYNVNTMQKPRMINGEPLNIPYLTEAYNDYKLKIGKLDYNDVLGEGARHKGYYSPTLYLDEAQDFSKIMWRIIDNWECDRRVIVGDDDQAIYSFLGASIDGFRAHIQKPYVLSQSHRISDDVRALADDIIGPARTILKQYHGIGKTVLKNYAWHDFLNLSGTKAILCRTNAMAHKLSNMTDAIIFSINVEHRYSNGWTKRVIKLLDIMNKMPKIKPEEFQYLVKNTPAGMWVRGTKTQVLRAPQLFTYDRMKGALKKANIIDKLLIKDQEKKRIISYLGKPLPPVVYVDTMHSTKGLEFDHVIVGTDCPRNISINDDERRLLYVAATRAKLTLGFRYFKFYANNYRISNRIRV